MTTKILKKNSNFYDSEIRDLIENIITLLHISLKITIYYVMRDSSLIEKTKMIQISYSLYT